MNLREQLSSLVELLYNNRKIICVSSEKNKIELSLKPNEYIQNERFKELLDKRKFEPNNSFLLIISLPWTDFLEKQLCDCGFQPDLDYVFLQHKPIVLKNIDLNGKTYVDHYGNTVVGNTKNSTITLTGFCSHATLSGKIVQIDLNMSTESTMIINNAIIIGAKIDLKNRASVRLNDTYFEKNVILSVESSKHVSIEKQTHILKNVLFKAYEDIQIGHDCIVADNCVIQGGDGHTIFDLDSLSPMTMFSQKITIGDHVFIRAHCYILGGTQVSDGSIVLQNSVTYQKYPNNCVIGGNPATILKTDVAWARKRTSNIEDCGNYARKTSL